MAANTKVSKSQERRRKRIDLAPGPSSANRANSNSSVSSKPTNSPLSRSPSPVVREVRSEPNLRGNALHCDDSSTPAVGGVENIAVNDRKSPARALLVERNANRVVISDASNGDRLAAEYNVRASVVISFLLSMNKLP